MVIGTISLITELTCLPPSVSMFNNMLIYNLFTVFEQPYKHKHFGETKGDCLSHKHN